MVKGLRPKGKWKCQPEQTVTAVIIDLEGRSPKRMGGRDQEQEY